LSKLDLFEKRTRGSFKRKRNCNECLKQVLKFKLKKKICCSQILVQRKLKKFKHCLI